MTMPRRIQTAVVESRKLHEIDLERYGARRNVESYRHRRVTDGRQYRPYRLWLTDTPQNGLALPGCTPCTTSTRASLAIGDRLLGTHVTGGRAGPQLDGRLLRYWGTYRSYRQGLLRRLSPSCQ